MFSHLRDPRGRFTLLAIGLACLLLAGFAPVPAVCAALVAAGLGCIGCWAWRRRQDRYDLKRLFDDPPPSIDEPECDTIEPDEIGAPYCGWCDEAYPPGTYRCRQCGRALG